jgi:hypothetical protein
MFTVLCRLMIFKTVLLYACYCIQCGLSFGHMHLSLKVQWVPMPHSMTLLSNKHNIDAVGLIYYAVAQFGSKLQLASATLTHTFFSSGDYTEGNALLHIFLVLRKQLCAINKGCTHIWKSQKHAHENIRNRDCHLDSAKIELCSIIQISLAQDCHPLFVGWCHQQMWELYSTATNGLSVIMYSQTQKPHYTFYTWLWVFRISWSSNFVQSNWHC